MAVDPLYYLVQIIIFPIAAITFGFCLHTLGLEIAAHGYVLSPRCVFHLCICMSSFTFCILQLDPSSVLGILPTQWRYFVGYAITSFLLNTGASTFYLYVVVLSARHLSSSKVPPMFTNLWTFANILTTTLELLAGLIGGITDNAFWFGICNLIVIVQELTLLGLVHVVGHKLGSLLKELEKQVGTKYRVQRQKLWFIRIATTILICTNTANALVRGDFSTLTEPRPSIGFDPAHFDPSYPIPDILITLAHLVLLYAMQKPQREKSASHVVNMSSHLSSVSA